jgi:predicted ester cyclase
MSAEDNKALVRRYFEAIDATSDENMLDEFLSADFVDHNPSPGCSADLDGMKAAYRMFVHGAPGTHSIEDMVAEGDKVVVRVSARGTHSGELFGIPASGREFTSTGIAILRIENGKIVEHWNEVDMMGAMVQIGAVTPPGGS